MESTVALVAAPSLLALVLSWIIVLSELSAIPWLVVFLLGCEEGLRVMVFFLLSSVYMMVHMEEAAGLLGMLMSVVGVLFAVFSSRCSMLTFEMLRDWELMNVQEVRL